ncbi:hypothetical protein [Leptospira alexanderi]|uniref:Ankyrin repeat protein n=1 Tax=Leptospira alexanderi serovar Manhao 3 str. L 60 TaxID=1049759 RepID=V6I7Z8_9LEPT|nr:hypothetical protein [Leptospira alexanderi]EQA62954.1 hypothetical protein LEP1GSC062_1204 [Leptospira alexanderi serovar Manhao 3 str. L 60]
MILSVAVGMKNNTRAMTPLMNAIRYKNLDAIRFYSNGMFPFSP